MLPRTNAAVLARPLLQIKIPKRLRYCPDTGSEVNAVSAALTRDDAVEVLDAL